MNAPRHPKLGVPHRIWNYVNADLTPFCSVARWDLPGGKEIRQFHVNGKSSGSGPNGSGADNPRIEWTRPDGKAPLFRLPELLKGGTRVLVVAGEKTADAAKRLFPGWSVTTSLGGESAPLKSDWSPMRGKHVTVWPDADDPGWKYFLTVQRLCREAGAASVHVVEVPASAPDGWDVADDPPDGWRLDEMLENAVEYRTDAYIAADSSPANDEQAPEFSEEALALAFADEHTDTLRYCDGFGRWYLWDGRWVADEKRVVFTMARKLCRAQADRALRRLKDGQAIREAKRLASKTTVANVVNLANCDERLAVASSEFDSDLMLINTIAGTIELKTCVRREHRRSDLITKMTAVDLAPPGIACPLWMVFLNRIMAGDVEMIRFLQRVAGYCLTGLTVEHALFFLWGTGANGKSTFINTLTGIWGDYATVADMEMLTETPMDRHPTELARLHGARLVTAQETGQGRRWAESRIKALTGGDPITARFMRRDFFEFVPQFKLMIAGNHKPGLRGIDEAIRRRLHMIPFTVRIPPDERDLHLFGKLKEEGPAILRWAIEGCPEWQRIGLNPPAAVIAATDEYFDNEDVLGQWLYEFVSSDQFGFESTSELYASWKSWAERAGQNPGSQKAFSQNLIDRGYTHKGTEKAKGFKGIRLNRKDYTNDRRYGG